MCLYVSERWCWKNSLIHCSRSEIISSRSKAIFDAFWSQFGKHVIPLYQDTASLAHGQKSDFVNIAEKWINDHVQNMQKSEVFWTV